MSRLFIFSFDTLQAWKTFPAGLLTGLLILVGIEVFVARSEWIVKRFPASNLGVVSAMESKVIDGAQPEIICLGNSRLRDGISPRVLERTLDLPEGSVLNLALTGGTPFDSLVLYRRNRDHLRNAKILIVDFEYSYFSDAPGLTPRVAAYATLEDRVRLFRGRKELIPSLVGNAWQTFGLREYLRALINDPAQTDALVLADDGRIVWRDVEKDLEIDVQQDIERHAKEYAWNRLDEGHSRELQRLISLAHEDGTFVILLHVPLRDGLVEYLMDTQAKQYQQLRSEFFKCDFGADLTLDWERGGDIGICDEAYYDYGHVKDSGSRRISEAVGAQLIKVVRTQPSERYGER